MTVRCKMKCSSVGEHESGPGKTTHSVTMYPVTGGSEENKSFFTYTPGGKLELQVIADRHFVPGKFYYIDITEAD